MMGVNDRLAFGVAIGGVRICRLVAIEKRVEGIGRVQMGITPQQLPLGGGGVPSQHAGKGDNQTAG